MSRPGYVLLLIFGLNTPKKSIQVFRLHVTDAPLQGVVIGPVVRIWTTSPRLSSNLLGKGLKRSCIALAPARTHFQSSNFRPLLIHHAFSGPTPGMFMHPKDV